MNREYYLSCPARVQSFLNYQSTIKNKSEQTINEYCLDLRLFFRFLLCVRNGLNYRDNDVLNQIDIRSISDDFYKTVLLDDAYLFLSYCKNDRNNFEKARARKVSSIRVFFKYLRMNLIIDDDPMVNLDTPKLKKSLPKYLTIDQSKQLLMAVQGKNKERDYCILTFFLNCGMRLSELVSIDYNKIIINNDSASVVLTGKGNKERVIYLNHACVSALNRYMRVRPKDGVIDKDALFLSNRLTRISKSMVQHIVEKYLKFAGLDQMGFSTHKLRHTAATLMYQTGNVDLLELKEILGHENLNTTQIYTHLLDSKLKAAVDANPLAEVRPPDFNTARQADDTVDDSESE